MCNYADKRSGGGRAKECREREEKSAISIRAANWNNRSRPSPFPSPTLSEAQLAAASQLQRIGSGMGGSLASIESM